MTQSLHPESHGSLSGTASLTLRLSGVASPALRPSVTSSHTKQRANALHYEAILKGDFINLLFTLVESKYCSIIS